MKKDRSYRVISMISLIVAIISLTVCFAAYSETIIINSNAGIKPNYNTFNISFSSSEAGVIIKEIVPTKSSDDITATNAVINNTNNPKMTGLSAIFTEPGQSVTYNFYVFNSGQYPAYLKSILYSNVNGKNLPKICTSLEGEAQSSVDSVCQGISLKVKVGSEPETSGSVASISKHGLAVGMSEQIRVTINYAQNSEKPEGPLNVEFGDVTLLYSSID